jgi:hypothetical protein
MSVKRNGKEAIETEKWRIVEQCIPPSVESPSTSVPDITIPTSGRRPHENSRQKWEREL